MAPSDRPGANSRGRGGKFRKFTRGGTSCPLSVPLLAPVPLLTSPGGKQFSRDLRPVDADGNPISMWSADAQKKFADGSGSEEEDDDDSEEEEDSDAGPSTAAQAARGEPSRADRKQDKKARKDAAIKKKAAQAVQVGDLPPSDEDDDSDEDSDDMPANPNHSKAARSMTKPPPPRSPDVDEAAEGVKGLAVSAGTPNRRERESLEAQQAKERYRKLHEQGKTDEAKADMARLRLIREQREAEAARRQVSSPHFLSPLLQP